MIHMSESLGVNCTPLPQYPRARSTGRRPPVARTTAWYGIRMARDLNKDHMLPLTKTFPQTRLGPLGDVAKVGAARPATRASASPMARRW